MSSFLATLRRTRDASLGVRRGWGGVREHFQTDVLDRTLVRHPEHGHRGPMARGTNAGHCDAGLPHYRLCSCCDDTIARYMGIHSESRKERNAFILFHPAIKNVLPSGAVGSCPSPRRRPSATRPLTPSRGGMSSTPRPSTRRAGRPSRARTPAHAALHTATLDDATQPPRVLT